jgi:hypothetical protein
MNKPGRPPGKYGARKTVLDGITFASVKESRRYSELKLLQRAGEISGLELQPVFMLQEGFTHGGKKHRPITYRADFRYVEKGVVVVEDSKGFSNPLYLLKKKLLLCRYPDINFVES